MKASARSVGTIDVILVECNVVDVDTIVRIVPTRPDCSLVGYDRYVDCGRGIVIAATITGGRSAYLCAHAKLGCIRLLSDILDEAAHRARSIERALGAAQHLDAVEIERY